MSEPNLVTTCNFNGRDFFIKMNVLNNVLELSATDKQTGEDWQCSYEASYIESITQKTGNFKQFDIFITMLKSGLLKTSNSIFLDLMTFEDLDAMRNHRTRGPYSSYHIAAQSNNNRRYLILTYTVEFDRIHYPLPLEYCGPPDPHILQSHVRRLEDEVMDLKEKLDSKEVTRCKSDNKIVSSLQKRIDDLSTQNTELQEEIKRLRMMVGKKPRSQIKMLQNAIKSLEKSVLTERRSHHQLVEKLKNDKATLARELEKIKSSEKLLRNKLKNSSSREPRPYKRIPDPIDNKTVNRSPRLCKSESWETQPAFHRTLRKNVRRKATRSSSESSDRFSDGLMRHQAGDKGSKIRSKTRKLNSPFSRSTSASSRSSTASRNVVMNRETIRIPSPQRVKSKASELDFTNLENRIHALQKMLQEGLVLK